MSLEASLGKNDKSLNVISSLAIASSISCGVLPESRPVHIQEICATMYRGLGIDTMSTTLLDNTGRPQYLLDHREPLKELI